MSSLPQHSVCLQSLAKPSWLHNWFCLGWQSYIAPSTTHRGSLHLLLAFPVTPKVTYPHAGSPCHGKSLAPESEQEGQINHRVEFGHINLRSYWQFAELCRREACTGARSHRVSLTSYFSSVLSWKGQDDIIFILHLEKYLRFSALMTVN